jgi:putative hemolysin
MGEITFEIIFIVILLITNGVFSMSEMAVVSARKARLQKRANDGEKGARAALELANNPGSFLPSVQIGITWSAFWRELSAAQPLPRSLRRR